MDGQAQTTQVGSTRKHLSSSIVHSALAPVLSGFPLLHFVSISIFHFSYFYFQKENFHFLSGHPAGPRETSLFPTKISSFKARFRVREEERKKKEERRKKKERRTRRQKQVPFHNRTHRTVSRACQPLTPTEGASTVSELRGRIIGVLSDRISSMERGRPECNLTEHTASPSTAVQEYAIKNALPSLRHRTCGRGLRS